MYPIPIQPPPIEDEGLSAQLFGENETRPVLALPIAANARGAGETKLSVEQSALLRGPVRCELRVGDQASSSAWLVQQARLTHDAGGGGDHSTERDRLIHETGDGLPEKLAEIGRTDGLAAVVEYLARLNIRFHDDPQQPKRAFSVKPRDPFRADELPSWLMLSPELCKDYGAAVIEFAQRHEHYIFRKHARRASLGGLANFQDVLLTVTRLLYGAYATGVLPFGSSVFSEGDFVDLPSLASKLKLPSRAVDTWLTGQVSSGTRAALAGYRGKISPQHRYRSPCCKTLIAFVRDPRFTSSSVLQAFTCAQNHSRSFRKRFKERISHATTAC